MVSRLGEGHMPCTFFLSEPQLKTTVKNNGTITYWKKINDLFHIEFKRPFSIDQACLIFNAYQKPDMILTISLLHIYWLNIQFSPMLSGRVFLVSLELGTYKTFLVYLVQMD